MKDLYNRILAKALSENRSVQSILRELNTYHEKTVKEKNNAGS
jgi:hypothetical protein